MADLIEITRKRLMDSIKAVQPPGRWKIVVVDSKSLKILNASCKMYDILEENVTLVENIEKNRQPYPTLEAIYYLTPCRESMLRLVDDFTAYKEPMYKAAHVHFTSGLDDDLFADLNKRLKSTGASEYIKGLKEMYVDYRVVESNVYGVDPPSSFFSVFGTDRRAYPESSLRITAKQLLSLCATLGEDPIIRYQVPPENDGSPALPYEGATKSLALALQRELDQFCQLNPNFPPKRSQPRATFLIVDRTIDQLAPLLHEFTYQAMINDLLPVKPTENGTGIVYSYEFTQADGSLDTKEVVLDEDDQIYKSIRHLHIAECTDRLVEEFNKFLTENKQDGKADTDVPKATARSLKDMKDMLTNLPHFQEMKAKYSAHLSIAQECMSYFEKHKLNSVGNLEQNIATGETPDGEIPKTIVLDMVPLLDDTYISEMDKARLLMEYIISKDGGIFEDDKRKLFDHAHLSRECRDAIENLSLMGVQLTRKRRPKTEKSTRKRFVRKRANRDDDQPYELSRYIPVIKKTMDAFLTQQLDEQQFAYSRASDREHEHGHDPSGTKAVTNQLSGVSLRTTRPTYRAKSGSGDGKRSSGSKLIVFVIGGMTYSEIRSTYEMADLYNRDIYIGTTELLRPTKYVENLSQLQMPAPRDPAIIAPYTPPPPKQTTLKPLIPKLNHSSSHASLNASSASPAPVPSGEDPKKKKKGLKKLFG
ncbi:Sec1-like protein [Hesseltinella vesiculosa]|uniref:Sec1-like protein n=1 Tax=Hesseltinella vesiculosa TaxID=101127 RepID=A0A1X2GWC2_9FUNG|nr:Sec1-like protein [Hesseltinella vesiculosa]